ncbi:hypothetical protein IscW_ISCW010243 [Ixodes scapularis]|uniref:C2H2-type domain-containing protein n=2 Tax=Ixodes scapularis TaxID=6945 RepID=B7Q2D2_IXOSC|nr:hypothetical protein IscW_ISCW010243 [Ixodes scapularis]|eukprot:XP_002410698.1 hypothetical protein IscW_ISCW010243 [Ixodes scapularis]
MASLASPIRMWPCTVCHSVFTQESGLLHHMEHMRMDPKHQFAAQYLLSRAAAERREKEGGPSTAPQMLLATWRDTEPGHATLRNFSGASRQDSVPPGTNRSDRQERSHPTSP